MEPFGTEEYQIDVDSLLPVLIALGDGWITPRKAAELVEEWMEGTDFREPQAQTWRAKRDEGPATLSEMKKVLAACDRRAIMAEIGMSRCSQDAATQAIGKVVEMLLEQIEEEESFDSAASCAFIFNS